MEDTARRMICLLAGMEARGCVLSGGGIDWIFL